MKILVTGGSGFIGSAVIRNIIKNTKNQIINVDKLTYAGNKYNLIEVCHNERYAFEKIDICNQNKINLVFKKYKPDAVMHLAAESHVDRSIYSPYNFIRSNIVGTYTLLNASYKYLSQLPKKKKKKFRFHHISTDEVYGDLNDSRGFFSENTPYAPSSPYSASKASSDHLVRAWHRTYNLPIVISNCSNNYGPYHFPEKLIPLTILNAIKGFQIPVYGKGNQIRDWLYVDDHASALYKVLLNGINGETYNIGGNNEIKNIEVVRTICTYLDKVLPSQSNKFFKKKIKIKSYHQLISFVADRPGHDLRYAVDTSKIYSELGWSPIYSFNDGIKKTVDWYLNNLEWVNKIKSIK